MDPSLAHHDGHAVSEVVQPQATAAQSLIMLMICMHSQGLPLAEISFPQTCSIGKQSQEV